MARERKYEVEDRTEEIDAILERIEDRGHTPLQDHFGAWVTEKVNPDYKTSKETDAFTAGARYALALRMEHQRSPENHEFKAELTQGREAEAEEKAEARAAKAQERAEAREAKEAEAEERRAARAEAKAAKSADAEEAPAKRGRPAAAAKAAPAAKARPARASKTPAATPAKAPAAGRRPARRGAKANATEEAF